MRRDPLGFRPGIPAPPGIRPGRVSASVDMTPMIDVMLALLIIFMVATPVLFQYTAELPEAENVVEEEATRSVTLGIDAEGAFFLGEVPVPAPELADRLRALYAGRREERVLYLRGDRGVSYRLVLDAIDAARAAGITRIGAVSELASGGPSTPAPGEAGR